MRNRPIHRVNDVVLNVPFPQSFGEYALYAPYILIKRLLRNATFWVCLTLFYVIENALLIVVMPVRIRNISQICFRPSRAASVFERL